MIEIYLQEPVWRKASYSNPNGACMEVAVWRKASYSESGNCAEVGSYRKSRIGAGEAVVGIRDTKQADLGGARTVLEFGPAAWLEFTTKIKAA
jgi:hypothetical protein